MDLSGTGLNVILVIVIVLFLGLNIFLKGRRARGTPLGRVATILGEVNHNAKLVENFSFHYRIGKMQTRNWQRNKDKVDFLPRDLWVALSKVFEMSEEFNERIGAARRVKSDSYMAGIDVSKLKAPLAKCKQELTLWLQENMQNPDYVQKRRGLFG